MAIESLRKCFRPLAGFWFLNFFRHCDDDGYVTVFPSPCGVLVLKLKYGHIGTYYGGRFPSPCGVLVLKLSEKNWYGADYIRVSVPLRGSGS